MSKAVIWRCSVKKLFVKISHYSQETPRLKSLFNKVAGLQTATLLKTDSSTSVSCEYCEIVKNTHFKKHLRTAASETCVEATA